MDIDSMIAVLQAYKEGKKIEERSALSVDEWRNIDSPLWSFPITEYRIKPEPQYRPFKSQEEVMEAIKEHGDWVKDIRTNGFYKITQVVSTKVLFCDVEETFEEAYDYGDEFLDGTPFGKLVEN